MSSASHRYNDPETQGAIIRADNAERARLDAMRHILAELPDPVEYAYAMPALYAHALMKAERRGSVIVLPKNLVEFLRPYGLVDYASTCLTAFGAAVWRALSEERDA